VHGDGVIEINLKRSGLFIFPNRTSRPGMVNIMCKYKKNIIFLFLISTPLLFSNCVISALYILNYSEKLVQNIENTPTVLSVRIRYADATFFASKHCMEILFNDGSSLEVSNVDERGGGTIEIDYVDDYACGIVRKNVKMGIPSELELKAWSVITGIELKNIYDIIENFQIIRECVESWSDLFNYRNDNETLSVASDRLLAENRITGNFIKVDGQDYYVYKYSRTAWEEFSRLWEEDFVLRNPDASREDIHRAWFNFNRGK
jgi:hypothetical protein